MKSPIISNDVTEALMNFDYRIVRAPFVGDGYIDLFFMGELEYALDNEQGKFCNFYPEAMTWATDYDRQDNQIAFSDNAVTCALNNFFRAPMSIVQIDEDRLNKMLSVFYMKEQEHMAFSTTSINKFWQLPLFERKIGKDVPMQCSIRFKDI